MYPAASYFLFSAVCAAVITWLVKVYALRSGLLDHPNARSSHVVPTPRGGGVGMVTSVLGVCIIVWSGVEAAERMTLLTVSGTAAMIAMLGFLDDKYSLTARLRMMVQVLATAIVLWALHQQPGLTAVLLWAPDWLTMALLALSIVWATNLYNFMDGIDGLAASQALFVGVATWWLIPSSDLVAAALAVSIAGAALGFLLWNWSPAAIFMGDVGSSFLGFMLAVLAIWAAAVDALSIWTSLILNSVFLADATVTLIRRLLRGQPWYVAHRSHVYQRLARCWDSHARVTLMVTLLNVLIALPVAMLSQLWVEIAAWMSLGFFVVLSILVVAWGGGDEAEGA